MKLEDYKKDYQEFSGLASNRVRSLAFGGIAVTWIFRTGSGNSTRIPSELLFPLLLFVISLGMDFLHYLIASAIWGLFHRWKERQNLPPEIEIRAPVYFNWFALFMFWGKAASVVLGYICLIRYIFGAWIAPMNS